MFIFKNFGVGAVSNFFGRYIAERLYSHIESEEPPVFSTPLYISAIIAGGFFGLISPKIESVLARTVLFVGLSRALNDVIVQMMGGTELNQETNIEDFIFDSIIIYYIVLTINAIYKMLYIKTKKKEFSEEVLGILPQSIAIKLYLNYRYASKDNPIKKKEQNIK